MSVLHRLAGRFPSLLIARRNVSRAKLRSLLAATTIAIGVIAIGAIGAGGAAFRESQLDTIRDQGATNVYVSPGFDKEEQYFDREDLLAIRDTVGPAGVVATRQTSVVLDRRGANRRNVSAVYIDDPRRLYDVQSGTIPTDWRRSVVISNSFARSENLSAGERVTIVTRARTASGLTETERTFRISAVLAETQAFGASNVYLPIDQAPDRQYDQLRVTTQSVESAERAAERLRDRFNGRKDRLLVFELTSLVRLFRTLVTGINTFLAGLGSLSLLVAGVSIANTMLMAVIKRREEIGVLRAVGYSRTDIVRILLVESALLGVIGAVAGLAVSLLIALVANAIFLGNPFAFSPTAVSYLLAAGVFGIATSLLAGVYPAWRAANERPVEALRG